MKSLRNGVWHSISRYFSSEVYRSVAKQAGWLMGGNSLGAVLALATMTVAARALGAEEFGVLVLITGYVLLVDGLANSQSWQALIRFSTKDGGANEGHTAKYALKTCLLVDVAFAVLGSLVAVTSVDLVATWFGWDDEAQRYARWFSLVILFHVSGAPTGVLRLSGRYRLLSMQPVIVSGVKLLGVTIAAVYGAGVGAYLFVWGVADILGHIFLLGAGIRFAIEKSLGGFWTVSLLKQRADLWVLLRFLLVTNLNSSVQLVVRRLDVLLIGGVLGEVSAGLYRVIKMFAQIPGQISNPFYQAVYPQIARYIGTGAWHEFSVLIKRISLSMGGVSFLFWAGYLLLGYWFIRSVFGEEFSGAWLPGVYYLLGTVVAGFALPLQPAVLAFGKPGLTLLAHVLSNLLFFIALSLGLPSWGLVAAGVSFLAYYLVWTALMAFFVLRLFRSSSGAERALLRNGDALD